MKKILLLCLITIFAFATERQREHGPVVQIPSQTINASNDVNPPVDPLVEELIQARKNRDWTTYNRLLKEWQSQAPVQENSNLLEPIAIEPDQNPMPMMRWGNDVTIYAGNVAYNSWAMINNIDDEAISVDHFRGDTLRAAVACADSMVRVFQSNDKGMTWHWIIGWRLPGYAVYEPEIINDPAGRFYHLFCRFTINNGDIWACVDSTPGGWFGRWVEGTADTVANYTVCSDRAEYQIYYLYCAYHKKLGGQGQDEIWFTRSLDQGLTWVAPTQLQFNGSGFPDLAYGHGDYLYMAYHWHASAGQKTIYTRRSSNCGASWFISVPVFEDTTTKQGPQIAAAHNGTGDAWVIFPRRDPATPNYDYGLFWSWTQDYGATWSEVAWVNSFVNYHEVLPSITIYDAAAEYYPNVAFISARHDWTNPTTKIFWWNPDTTWSDGVVYNDFFPEFTRPIMTWESNAAPALAYVGNDGVNVYYDSWSNATGGIVEEHARVPREKLLGQNRPNPFTTSTRLEYYVPISGEVSLKLYNSLGQELATLIDEYRSAGTYSMTLNREELPKAVLPAGVYFLKLQVNRLIATRKIIVQ